MRSDFRCCQVNHDQCQTEEGRDQPDHHPGTEVKWKGVPIGTVKTGIYRARQMLKIALENYETEYE